MRGVDAIACLGLSQQFGIAGITNFGFIIFQAAGAYAAGVLSLPRDSANGGFQTYIGGLNLPFPLPWIGAAIVGGLLAVPFAAIVGQAAARRLRGRRAARHRGHVQPAGDQLPAARERRRGAVARPVPAAELVQPASRRATSGGTGRSAVLLALRRLPLRARGSRTRPTDGRLRAMRDNDVVADSLGKNLRSLRTSSLVIGGAIAGLSGGVLVGFINLWDPQAWGYAETVVLFAAVIIGGLGNHRGAVLGAILVPAGVRGGDALHPAGPKQPGARSRRCSGS